MNEWPNDLSKLTMAAVIKLEAENRRWGKELRIGAAALTNKRLAKQIDREEYEASRHRGKDDAAEYRRRASALAEMLVRGA